MYFIEIQKEDSRKYHISLNEEIKKVISEKMIHIRVN